MRRVMFHCAGGDWCRPRLHQQTSRHVRITSTKPSIITAMKREVVDEQTLRESDASESASARCAELMCGPAARPAQLQRHFHCSLASRVRITTSHHPRC